jgi:hypothetical protein
VGLFVTLELVLDVVGITTIYSTRTGMGLIGPVSVEIGIIYLTSGIIFQYALDKLIKGTSGRDIKRTALVLAIANLIIFAIGEGGTLLYSIAIVGIIGFVTAQHSRMKLFILAAALSGGALIMEYWNHHTMFRTQTFLIVFFAVLCAGFFLEDGGRD